MMKGTRMKETVHTNYAVQGMEILLCKDCILQRFYPLIPYKQQVIQGLLRMEKCTSGACLDMTDEEWIQAGLPDAQTAALMRAFLHLYDYKGKGVRDIPDAENKLEAECRAWMELMHLPGVKAIRAELYYRCGYRSLAEFAAADAENMRTHMEEEIARHGWNFSVPLPKELRTQIAVAKVFTQYAVKEFETEGDTK